MQRYRREMHRPNQELPWKISTKPAKNSQKKNKLINRKDKSSHKKKRNIRRTKENYKRVKCSTPNWLATFLSSYTNFPSKQIWSITRSNAVYIVVTVVTLRKYTHESWIDKQGFFFNKRYTRFEVSQLANHQFVGPNDTMSSSPFHTGAWTPPISVPPGRDSGKWQNNVTEVPQNHQSGNPSNLVHPHFLKVQNNVTGRDS